MNERRDWAPVDWSPMKRLIYLRGNGATGGGGNKKEYIKDGLAFWMDGIDKGPNANAWTDKIGGCVFTAYNGVTFADDHVLLNGTNQYLKNNNDLSFNAELSTIEVAIDCDMTGTKLIYMPGKASPAQMAMGIYSNKIIWSCGLSLPMSTHNGAKCLSIRKDLSIMDGVVAEMASNDTWNLSDGNNYIGVRRGNQNFFDGKIYSIRIYNRLLSAEEMLHNQRVDNVRFNLGLNI